MVCSVGPKGEFVGDLSGSPCLQGQVCRQHFSTSSHFFLLSLAWISTGMSRTKQTLSFLL